jgi:hypothetical protein
MLWCVERFVCLARVYLSDVPIKRLPPGAALGASDLETADKQNPRETLTRRELPPLIAFHAPRPDFFRYSRPASQTAAPSYAGVAGRGGMFVVINIRNGRSLLTVPKPFQQDGVGSYLN